MALGLLGRLSSLRPIYSARPCWHSVPQQGPSWGFCPHGQAGPLGWELQK